MGKPPYRPANPDSRIAREPRAESGDVKQNIVFPQVVGRVD
jgi:hypothetical protein